MRSRLATTLSATALQRVLFYSFTLASFPETSIQENLNALVLRKAARKIFIEMKTLEWNDQ